ncbi:MAG: hypothetical protein E6G58_10805 [Actinobacteria bacterium]|nr:MAG: hypothetical protein E6G58_10805 [Actinomycetota bacterium]
MVSRASVAGAGVQPAEPMEPKFDPAVVEVLEAFGRRLAAGSPDAVPADEILARLPALEQDRSRSRVILKQLVSEGLLEERTPAAETTAGTYALTRLGRARIEQRRRPDDD